MGVDFLLTEFFRNFAVSPLFFSPTEPAESRLDCLRFAELLRSGEYKSEGPGVEFQTMSDPNNYKIGISKQELGQLPAAHFPGAIQLIDKPEDVAPAVDELRKARVIGFDTETRPAFQKGQYHSVALLQLSTESRCFLFRLNILGMQDEIRDLLEDPSVKKIGLSTHDDFHNLNRIKRITPAGFFELQEYVGSFKIEDRSLSKIYALLFGERISKGQRLTNWEAPELSPHQQAYAALDAYACLKIYNYLKSGNFHPQDSTHKIYPSLQ